MDAQQQFNELLEFFKALADENRLKIIGLLAQRPYTVGELAEAVGLSVSTASHHLSYLSHVGLASAQPEGHYYRYSLNLAALHSMAQRLLQTDALPKLTPEQVEDAFERKVLDAFIGPGGRFKSFPAQEKKYKVLVRHALRAFEPGKRYSEKEVNEILSHFHDDVASLRRAFIEYKLMEREGGGGAYWRVQ